MVTEVAAGVVEMAIAAQAVKEVAAVEVAVVVSLAVVVAMAEVVEVHWSC